jgi:acetoin utilization protein AcuC
MSSTPRVAIAYRPEFLAYDFGPQHPLRPERITASLDLLEEAGIWDPSKETVEPKAAAKEELELLHDPTYVSAVVKASTRSDFVAPDELARFGLSAGDNPAFLGMHEAAAFVTGGSIETARRLMRGDLEHAFNPAGGLHHANRARASGFCIYNDPALAAAVALEEFGARVMYVDFDCHHGDGVQWLFYQEPLVMTVSFHESGDFLFPGTGSVNETGEGKGKGYSVNWPAAPFTRDECWIEAIETIVPLLAQRFRPDIVISSHGADTHIWDPLTHLALTTRSFVSQAALIHQLAHQYCEGRWLAVGSGGYDWRRVVPRSWGIVWAEMSERILPDVVSEDWTKRWESPRVGPMPMRWMDAAEVSAPVAKGNGTARLNQASVRAVREIFNL